MLNNKKSDTSMIVMAVLFLITAVVGFFPTSMGLIEGVLSNQRELPPFIVHLHAFTMAAWLCLLLVQSLLVFNNKTNIHKQLGITSFVLAPLIVLSMLGVDIYSFHKFAQNFSGLPLDMPNHFANSHQPAFILVHFTSLIFFPFFFIVAMKFRKIDVSVHKRMIILATLVLLPPAIGRMLVVSNVLPDFDLNFIDARHLYLLVLMIPALIADYFSRGRVHSAYIMGFSVLGVWMVIAHFLSGSALWNNLITRVFLYTVS